MTALCIRTSLGSCCQKLSPGTTAWCTKYEAILKTSTVASIIPGTCFRNCPLIKINSRLSSHCCVHSCCQSLLLPLLLSSNALEAADKHCPQTPTPNCPHHAQQARRRGTSAWGHGASRGRGPLQVGRQRGRRPRLWGRRPQGRRGPRGVHLRRRGPSQPHRGRRVVCGGHTTGDYHHRHNGDNA